MILSKNLRNKYEKHIDIKRTLTIWFENLAIIDEFNYKWITDLELFDKSVKWKVNLLWDQDYLDARFNELVLIFCSSYLENIDTFDNSLNIPMSLASIFEYYWLFDDMNIALKHDDFFIDNNVWLNNKKVLKN
jgi:hypothetical protein